MKRPHHRTISELQIEDKNYIFHIERYCNFLESERAKNNITFLSQLVRYAKEYGWSGDYNEVVDFVHWCFDKLKIEQVNMNISED